MAVTDSREKVAQSQRLFSIGIGRLCFQAPLRRTAYCAERGSCTNAYASAVL